MTGAPPDAPPSAAAPNARPGASPRGPARLLRVLRWGSVLLAAGYLAALLAIALVFRFVGERWWVVTVAMYLPRWGFALPLPFIAAAGLLLGPRRAVGALLVAALGVLLFPVMGLRLGVGAALRGVPEGRPSLRVLSCNIAVGRDPAGIAALVRDAKPDLVLMQEFHPSMEGPLGEVLPGFHTRTEGQFFAANRWPIRNVFVPPKLAMPGSVPRSPRYVSYTLDSPFGPLDAWSVHPLSPREGMDGVRGMGIKHELLRGRLGGPEAGVKMRADTELRRRQVEAFSTEAKASPRPVIIAGDTNLPALSWIFARYLGGDLADGFTEAGRGFGNTYPAHKPWMRIDRIVASRQLTFRRFQVVKSQASDHLCIWADLTGA